MNYIKQLESEREALIATVDLTGQQIAQFMAFLHSSKFTGTENGERKDWIATGDVIQWLRELRNTLHQNGE
jgi:hypothetical protein